MIKKSALFIVLTILFSDPTCAEGIVVGESPIIAVEEYSNSPSAQREDPIVLIKPLEREDGIKLISQDEFLSMYNKNYQEVVSSIEKHQASLEQEKTKIQLVPLEEIEIVEEETTPVAIEPVLVAPKVEAKPEAQILRNSEFAISYSSDKKTLLSHEAKVNLENIAKEAKSKGMSIGVETYATGEKAMATRVSLLRANIIKNTLKSYGVDQDRVDIKSFGNSVNINQARVFLVK